MQVAYSDGQISAKLAGSAIVSRPPRFSDASARWGSHEWAIRGRPQGVATGFRIRIPGDLHLHHVGWGPDRDTGLRKGRGVQGFSAFGLWLQ